MFSSTARLTGWRLAGIVAAVGAFVVASAGAGSAATFGTPYQIGLNPNTPTPITAATFATTASCDGVVPPWLDGWHFEVPGGATLIVSLGLVFNGPSTSTPTATATATPTATATATATATPTTTRTVSSSPYSVAYTMDRQGAYVATLPGAQLVSAAATVVTETGQTQAQYIVLANTCPASTSFSFSTPAAGSDTFSPFSSALLPTGQDTPIPASVPLVGTGAVNGASASPSPTCTPSSDPPAASASATPNPTTAATSTATRSAAAGSDVVAATTSTPTPTPTPTATATATASATPTASASATPTASATASDTPLATSTSGCAAAPTPSAVPGNLSVTG